MRDSTLEALLNRIETLAIENGRMSAHADVDAASRLVESLKNLEDFLSVPGKIRFIKLYRSLNPSVSLRAAKEAIEASPAMKLLALGDKASAENEDYYDHYSDSQQEAWNKG